MKSFDKEKEKELSKQLSKPLSRFQNFEQHTDKTNSMN
jgi:hypothetical protein